MTAKQGYYTEESEGCQVQLKGAIVFRHAR